jgi:hypothetical protein
MTERMSAHARRRDIERKRREYAERKAAREEHPLKPRRCPLRCTDPPTSRDIDGDVTCVLCGRAR